MNSGTVVKVNYVKDDSQTQPTKYLVKHVVDGVEQTGDTRTYEGTAWINDAAPAIVVAGDTIQPNTYEGYKYVSTDPSVAGGQSVPTGTTITLTYVKDDGQTQPTDYTVEYYKDGQKVTEDSYTEHSTAWINDDPAQIAIKLSAEDSRRLPFILLSTGSRKVNTAGAVPWALAHCTAPSMTARWPMWMPSK